ncbi:hypothetical protein PHSC3_001221 [Chlamydiales bacterium STE3]|nr:hypothetical protein PHSC3_001221 [Chlamydiales bacterium STE3]
MNKSLLAELESTKSLLQTVLINTQEKEKELISLKEQLLQSKENLQEKEIQDQESKKEIDNYKRKQRQFERVIHFLRKRLEEAHLENKELFSAFQQVQMRHQELEQVLQTKEKQKQELEDELMATQQHLAQKVKEARLLMEENGFLKEEIQKLKVAITAAYSKSIDNQNSFEIEWNHQKRPQEQYSDSLASFESPSFRWKEKCLYMQKKWQKAEAKVSEYKQFEETPQKMYTISKHLSNLLEMSLALHSTPCQSRSLKHLIVKIDKPLQINQLIFFGLVNTSTKVKTFIK